MGEIIQQIICFMKANKITQRELSRRTGIAERCISRWFLGQVEPKILHIEEMCKALDLEIKLCERN